MRRKSNCLVKSHTFVLALVVSGHDEGARGQVAAAVALQRGHALPLVGVVGLPEAHVAVVAGRAHAPHRRVVIVELTRLTNLKQSETRMNFS